MVTSLPFLRYETEGSFPSRSPYRVSVCRSAARPAVQGTVLDRLGNVFRLDGLRPLDIGDGPRNLQDPIEGTGGQPQALHGHLQQVLRLAIHLTVLPDLPRAHVRVAIGFAAAKPLLLEVPCPP